MRSFIRCKSAFVVAIAAVVAVSSTTDTGSLVLGGRPAEAVIGRPLTPMSYAGVARRTTRRTYRRGAYGYGYGGYGAYSGYYGAAYAPPVVPTTAVVTTLPPACGQIVTASGVYYQCGGARYAPAYNAGTVVYTRY